MCVVKFKDIENKNKELRPSPTDPFIPLKMENKMD